MKAVTGDLIQMAKAGKFDAIIHGCNAFNTMGGGIAKTIKNTWPEAYAADCKTKKGDYKKLGKYTVVSVPNPGSVNDTLLIINAYTQFKYWRDKNDTSNDPLVDYDALRLAFRNIKKTFGSTPLDAPVRFGIPKIGAGLALGDWAVISQIIDEEMAGEDVTLVEWVG